MNWLTLLLFFIVHENIVGFISVQKFSNERENISFRVLYFNVRYFKNLSIELFLICNYILRFMLNECVY